MSTDRELLELAAKAANIPINFTPEGIPFHAEMQGSPGFRCWVAWNPLADDGDALRLAAMLEIDLEYGTSFPSNTAGGSVQAKRRKDWSFRCAETVSATVSYCRTAPILKVLESDKKFAEYMSRPERCQEQWATHEAEATRRAIVRAAAEIGRAMP